MNTSQLLAASLLHSQLEKKAEGFWSGVGDIALGTGGAAGALDPAQRGMVQDVALYSNPFSGVPTALNDSVRNFSRGNYLSGVGNLAMGALSFAPGVGATLGKGIGWLGKGLRGAGKLTTRAAQLQKARAAVRGGSQLAGAPMRVAGSNVGAAANIGNRLRAAGGRIMDAGESYGQMAQKWEAPLARVNQRLATQIQQKVPQKFDQFSWRNPIRSGFDAAARKPVGAGLTATSVIGGGGSAPTTPTPSRALQATAASQPKTPPPWAPPQRPYSL